ncbi:MAG: NAD(P)H-hydrate epimerase [Nannocystaceae bacterium]
MTEDPSALWTAAESAAADRHTMDDLGIPSLLLMERAALCVAHEVAARLAPGQRVIALCGPGNNGGDGVAMARILRGWGVDAEVRLCAPRHNEVVAEQLRLARALSVPIHEGLPASAVEDDAVLVDALLGTGAAGAPRGAIEAAIRWFNAGAGPRVAIDLPTGVDADTGALPGIAAVSQLTVTMQRSKPGLHITPGRGCAGAVVIADIGLRAAPITASAPSTRLIEPRVTQAPHRRAPAGAGAVEERGHVGVIGGSVGTAGAADLDQATAALRCGVTLHLAARDPGDVDPLPALRPELDDRPTLGSGRPAAGRERPRGRAR